MRRPESDAGRDRRQGQQGIDAAFDAPKMKARFADLGGVALPGSLAAFGKLIADETEKWGKVIKTAGIKPE